MKAKEYLSQIEIMQVQIEQKRARAAELRELAMCTGGFDYSKERVQTSTEGGKLENDVTRYLELEAEMVEDTYRLNVLKNTIVNQIHTLDDAAHIRLLYKRYVECKRLELVAVEMHYTYQYVREMHGRALQSFQKVIQPTQTYIRV